MNRPSRFSIRFLAVAAATATVAALALGPGANAAPPPPPEKPDGVVNAASREHKWSASNVVLYGGWGELDDMQCLDPAVAEEVCDFEYIQVDVPAGGEARLDVGFATTGPAPSDFDMTVYDPTGKVIGTGTSAPLETGESTKLSVKKSGIYVVEIAHYLSVGGGYDAYMRLR